MQQRLHKRMLGIILILKSTMHVQAEKWRLRVGFDFRTSFRDGRSVEETTPQQESRNFTPAGLWTAILSSSIYYFYK
jgi:hypothetical protein